MSDRDLFAAAAPECLLCEKPIARLEHSWRTDPDGSGRWLLAGVFKVCPDGHRELVEEVD